MLQLLPILYLTLFAFIIYRSKFFHVPDIKPIVSVALFTCKVFAAFMLYVVYTKTYTDRAMADIFKFFDDSKALHQLFFTAPADFFVNFFGKAEDFNYYGKYSELMNHWVYPYGNRMYNDNRMLIRLHTFFRFFSGGNYHVHSVCFAFLSFTGLHLIAKAFTPWVKQHFKWMYLSLFLFPSILFWGSGCLKETLLIFELGLAVYFFFQFCKKASFLSLILTLTSLVFIAFTKIYILIVLIPGLLAYFIVSKWQIKKASWVYLGVFVSLLIIATGISFLSTSYDFARLITTKQHGFVNVAKETLSGSLISDYKMEPSWKGIFTFLPTALYRVFMLPFPWEGKMLEKIAGLENLLLVICLFISFCKLRLNNISNAYLFALSFALLLYTLIGLTVPVVGAMVRYKIPAIIFFILIVFMNIQDTKSKKIA